MVAEVSAQGGERVSQAGELRLARVESLRALAALGVVIGHLWATAHGFENPDFILGTLPRRLVFGLTYGVWVFFGLTGYLLFWPFVRRQFGEGGTIDLRRYAANRALRILPLYYIAVILLLLVQVPDPTRQVWWRHLLLVQNFWRESIGRVDAPIWSVVVEVQFYALLPLLALGLFRLAGRSRARAAAVLGLLAAASMVARQLLALEDADSLSLWRYQLPTTFGFFAAGMAVALLRSAWEERRPAVLDRALGAPWLWLAAAVPLYVVMCWRLDYENLAVPAVFLVVGALVLPLRPSGGLRALDWRPLALLGVISYSLYVWHAPLLLELEGGRTLMAHGFPVVLAALLPLLIAVAAISYLLIERPALRQRRRWAPSSPAPDPAGPS
jgi:peptidoglycan/LPS O-acetylase OafA/YrhL